VTQTADPATAPPEGPACPRSGAWSPRCPAPAPASSQPAAAGRLQEDLDVPAGVFADDRPH